MKKELNKIIVIGDAGRGKTTLAEKLSQKLGIKHYSTDDFYYEIKFSKPRTREEASKLISEVYQNEKWIAEGTTQWLLQPGLDSADTIIYLKYNNIFSQWLVLIKRHFIRKDKSLWHTFLLLRHVLYKRYGWGHKKGKIKHHEVVAPYSDKVVTLSSFKEINDFINHI
jgi:adenylate kinase family enzyme